MDGPPTRAISIVAELFVKIVVIIIRPIIQFYVTYVGSFFSSLKCTLNFGISSLSICLSYTYSLFGSGCRL